LLTYVKNGTDANLVSISIGLNQILRLFLGWCSFPFFRTPKYHVLQPFYKIISKSSQHNISVLMNSSVKLHYKSIGYLHFLLKVRPEFQIWVLCFQNLLNWPEVTFNYDIQVFHQQQLCREQKDKFNHILFDTVGFLESEKSQLKK
jgi:hypothetical protein